MIPSDFIRGCLHQYVNVCLKNGDLYNGILDECDNMNNFVLLEVNVVTRTRKEFSLERAMIRGGSIKLICLPNHVIDLVKTKRAEAQRGGQNQTGGYGQQNNKWQKDKQNFNKDHQNNNNNYNNNNNNYNNRNRGGRGGYRGGRGGARGRGGYNNYNNNHNNHNNYNNNNNDNGFVYTPS